MNGYDDAARKACSRKGTMNPVMKRRIVAIMRMNDVCVSYSKGNATATTTDTQMPHVKSVGFHPLASGQHPSSRQIKINHIPPMTAPRQMYAIVRMAPHFPMHSITTSIVAGMQAQTMKGANMPRQNFVPPLSISGRGQ